MNLRVKFIFGLTLLLSILLYLPIFSIYFFQDDFFLFSITHVKSIFDLFKFFIPRSDVQFYRPIGAEILFFILRMIFGWKPLFYHLAIYMFFIVVVYLVFKISRYILKTNRKALIISLLYSTSAIHYNSLAWLSNSAYIIGPVFFFLALYSVFKKRQNTYLSIFSYILGLLTFEFAIILPFIILIGDKLNLYQLRHKKSLYLTLFVTSVLYFLLRFVLFHPNSSSYHFEINKSVVSSYRFFILYLLNWPETMKDNFLKFWLIRPSFMMLFRFQIIIWFINSIVMVLGGTSSIIFFLKKEKNKLIFLIVWVLLGLLPIIFIPSHIAPHYGNISLLPFLILLCCFSIKKLQSKIYQGLYLILAMVWVFSSSLTINFNQNHHWIKYRSDIAKYWIGYFEKNQRTIRQNNQVDIYTDDKEVKIALFGDKAVKEFLLNNAIHVDYFREEKNN